VSRLFPRADYAEDQRYWRTILTTHVLHRGVQTGAAIGTAVGLSRTGYAAIRSSRPGIARPRAGPVLLRSAGVGGAIGLAAISVAFPLRMWGQEEKQWRDRSWRLLENAGQVAVDDWSVGGVAAAAEDRAVGLESRGGESGAGQPRGRGGLHAGEGRGEGRA